MPSGFVSRTKGRSIGDFSAEGTSGIRQFVRNISFPAAGSTTLSNSGLSVLGFTSAAQVVALDAPQPGVEKSLGLKNSSMQPMAARTIRQTSANSRELRSQPHRRHHDPTDRHSGSNERRDDAASGMA